MNYKFSHSVTNGLRGTTPNHEPLTLEVIKELEAYPVKDTHTLIKNGLVYKLKDNMIAIHAVIGNSLSNNQYSDYYFKD